MTTRTEKEIRERIVTLEGEKKGLTAQSHKEAQREDFATNHFEFLAIGDKIKKITGQLGELTWALQDGTPDKTKIIKRELLGGVVVTPTDFGVRLIVTNSKEKITIPFSKESAKSIAEDILKKVK